MPAHARTSIIDLPPCLSSSSLKDTVLTRFMGAQARPGRQLGVLTVSIEWIGVEVEALNETDERLHLLLLQLHVMPHLLHALHRDTLSRSSNHSQEHRHKGSTSHITHKHSTSGHPFCLAIPERLAAASCLPPLLARRTVCV